VIDLSYLIRVGSGYDIHRLVEERDLVIGGVVIPSTKGEAGHSDGDVLIHAIIDALLGASACGDIGTHFPPSDPHWKDISSRILLRETIHTITHYQYSIINIDSTIILEEPKVRPYIQEIRKTLSTDLDLPVEQVSVKAKTKEKLDAVGKGEAIEAFATALLTIEGRSQ
jgi:2-C-methyl-D-erythritol 2,4-cyclodiphosphate synthase